MLAAGRLASRPWGGGARGGRLPAVSQCLPSEERPVCWVLIYEECEIFPFLYSFYCFICFFSWPWACKNPTTSASWGLVLETSSQIASLYDFLRPKVWKPPESLAFAVSLLFEFRGMYVCAYLSLHRPFGHGWYSLTGVLIVSTLSQEEAGWRCWVFLLPLCPAPLHCSLVVDSSYTGFSNTAATGD